MIRAYLYDGENVVRESDGDADPVRDFTSTDEQYGALLSEYDTFNTQIAQRIW